MPWAVKSSFKTGSQI